MLPRGVEDSIIFERIAYLISKSYNDISTNTKLYSLLKLTT
jgi:hypothetical protein